MFLQLWFYFSGQSVAFYPTNPTPTDSHKWWTWLLNSLAFLVMTWYISSHWCSSQISTRLPMVFLFPSQKSNKYKRKIITKLINDQFYLLDIVLTLKQDLSCQELSKGTSQTPNVYRFGIFMRRKHHFRGTIISRHHIFSQGSTSFLFPILFFFLVLNFSRKTEIAWEKCKRKQFLRVKKKKFHNLVIYNSYHIFMSQFSLARMLEGFKSRWMMFAECK